MSGNTSACGGLMKQEGPPAPGPELFCASVRGCRRRQWSPEPAPSSELGPRATVFSRGFARTRSRACSCLSYPGAPWLSRGEVLKKLPELHTEVLPSPHQTFFKSKEKHIKQKEEFIHGLAYLLDIFGHSNEVNLSTHRYRWFRKMGRFGHAAC